MIQVLQCVLLAAFCMALFYLFGAFAALICKWETSGFQLILIGFFVYFSLFQIIALPMILMKKSLTSLNTAWWIICILLLVLTIVLAAVKRSFPLPEFKGFFKNISFAKIAAVGATGFLGYFVGVQRYLGWDTSYYIGTINISVYTDSMYIVDGYTGVAGEFMDLRYALSSFYMHSAVLCKTFRLHPALMQQYTIGTLCVVLSCIVVYLIGRELFPERKNSPAVLTLCWIFLNFFFKTDFTTSQFLLYRAYEAKAFCANVIALSVLYIVIRLWKQKMRGKQYWQELFLVVFASVPISMSSMLLIPAFLGIMLAVWLFVHRDLKVIPYGFICVLPNLSYILLYVLYAKDYLLISIK